MNRLSRIGAFLIDHVIITLLSITLYFLLTWDMFISPTQEDSIDPFEVFYPFLGAVMVLYFIKDIVQGRSIGKRIVGIAIRDVDNENKVPNKLKLVLRNVSIIIWPIELIILFVTGNRLGDYLVNSKVIKQQVYQKENGIEQ